MVLETEKLEILADHYTHTFNFLQSHLKKRDRLFAWVSVLLVIMLFQIYTPDETSNILTQFVSEKLGVKDAIKFPYIQSILWFFLLASIIKNFQSIVFIERQYSYIHSLENHLSGEYGGCAFTREGESYLLDYPVFLNWASFLYTVLFPIILLVVIVSKIIIEFKQYGFLEVLIWFNFSQFIFIIVSLVLYLYAVHRESLELIKKWFSIKSV